MVGEVEGEERSVKEGPGGKCSYKVLGEIFLNRKQPHLVDTAFEAGLQTGHPLDEARGWC